MALNARWHPADLSESRAEPWNFTRRVLRSIRPHSLIRLNTLRLLGFALRSRITSFAASAARHSMNPPVSGKRLASFPSNMPLTILHSITNRCVPCRRCPSAPAAESLLAAVASQPLSTIARNLRGSTLGTLLDSPSGCHIDILVDWPTALLARFSRELVRMHHPPQESRPPGSLGFDPTQSCSPNLIRHAERSPATTALRRETPSLFDRSHSFCRKQAPRISHALPPVTESDSPYVACVAQQDAVRKPVPWILVPRVQLAPHRCQRVVRQRILLFDRQRSRIRPCPALAGTRCPDLRALSDQ